MTMRTGTRAKGRETGVAQAQAPASAAGAGGRMVAVDGKILPLRGVAIEADAGGGIARVRVEQRFVNPYPEPLQVTYLVPLPPEGAVAGYAIRVGERRIVGEVDRLETARERYEEALAEGRSAGLVEQERSNLFTQEIGNIPAGAEVVAELSIDQPLKWLEQGGWEWRFPTVVAPRYLGAEGRVADAARVTVDVADGPLPVAMTLGLAIRDALAEGRDPESPSHAIRVTQGSGEPGRSEVSLAADEGGASLDRDVVVRWPVARPEVGVSLGTGRPAAGRPHADAGYGLLTIVPPSPASRPEAFPRDLILLIDTSGSMHGEPLAQARRIAEALVRSLTDRDRLELIAFSDRPRRWKGDAVTATERARAEALGWLEALEADGGTEMREGIVAALRPLREDAQRQVVLVTDGLIGFEQEIVRTVLDDLPPASRLHAVGVGPSVNRELTRSAARAGRGVEIVLGLEEDAGPAAQRLVAGMQAPVLTGVELSGSALVAHAPGRLPDVYAGAPARVAVRLRPEGGEVRVRGLTPTGVWEETMTVRPIEAGTGNDAVVALFGREAVEDLEMRAAAGESCLIGSDVDADVESDVDADVDSDVDAGVTSDVDAAIERIGLDFQIATRRTSWVAISEEPTVDPTQPWHRERIPHALPQGLSAEGLGLRRGSGFAAHAALMSVAPYSLVRQPEGVLYAPGAPLAPSDLAPDFCEPSPDLGAPAPPAPMPLQGRVALRRGREVVLELTAEAALDWQPRRPELVWAEGTGLRARIDWRQSTRRGAVAPGQVIRLVLRLMADGPEAAPVVLVLSGTGSRLLVHLSS